MDEYLAPSARVLDIGGGPGRYSIYLAQQGHLVTLMDLAQKHIEQARKKSQEAGVNLAKIFRGNVLELDRLLPGESFDAVLCMGPLYHIGEENERKKAILQCRKALKPGGVLAVPFISVFAPLIGCLKSNPARIAKGKKNLLGYLEDGCYCHPHDFTDAYFVHPATVEPFMTNLGFATCRITAVEGIGSLAEERLMRLPEAEFQQWVDVIYHTGQDA